MDYFSTTALQGVLPNLKVAQSFLLDRFFPNVITFDTEEVAVDIDKGLRRIAPLVSPLVQGKIVESRTFSTKTFRPAYVKPKTPFRPNRALKRTMGETIGGNLSPAQRMQLLIMQELRDHVEQITRRLELMAAQGLITGKVVVKGEGYPEQLVDFQRDATLTVTLEGTHKWDQAGATPLDDLDAWALLILQKSGAQAIDVVMDITTWLAFSKTAQVQDELKRLATAGQIPLDLGIEFKSGASFRGTVRGFNIWVYVDWYIDPDTNTEVPMLPSGTVILGSAQIQGARLFGAIQDEAAGLMPLQYFSKSWLENDPAVRFVMTQSAPLPVPTRVDASLSAKVL